MNSMRTLVPLLMVLVGACNAPAHVIPSGATEVPQVGASNKNGQGRSSLSRHDRMRAIATRTRLARRTHQESETLMRTYDTEGHIVGEYVRRGTQWVERPHTLTAEWAARPLRDFLPESGPVASLCSSCDPIVGTHTGAAYDSVVSSNESITLDGVVDTAGASLNVAASASSPNLEFMMYGGGGPQRFCPYRLWMCISCGRMMSTCRRWCLPAKTLSMPRLNSSTIPQALAKGIFGRPWFVTTPPPSFPIVRPSS